MSLLELKNVSYFHDDARKRVLKNINIEFDKGKVYVIIGKSRTEKGAFLSLISGLDVCTDGEVVYNGENLKTIDRDGFRAKDIGFIYHKYNFLINDTAVENLVLSMDISSSGVKDKKAFAYELLEKMGIDRKTANKKVIKLSCEEQQKISMAKVLSHSPGLIVANESGNGIDNDEMAAVKMLVSLAHNDGKCVIIVTDSKKIPFFADELWSLADGRLLFIK